MAALADRLPPALRGLLRHKRFSALAVVSLGVAIALNTTMYSVLDALLFPRVDMRAPERLYRLAFYGDYRGRIPAQDKLEALQQTRMYGGMARRAGTFSSNYVERGARLREVRVIVVSPNYFELVGNQPLAGRLLSTTDEAAETRSVVISERLWNQLFPERSTFDTATILLNGEPRAVVGLLGAHADFPGQNTDVWALPGPNDRRFSALIFNLVRLRDGVSVEAASVELDGLAKRFAAQAGEGPRDARFDLQQAIGEPFRFLGFYKALIGAVLAVLLIACFNLANLQLARGISRAREFATRAAIGATRRDIILQLMGESAWLAGGGVLLGVLLTLWGMQFVTTSMPPAMSEYFVEPEASWRVFAFAGIVGVLSLALVGLLPALKLSKVNIHELIKSGAGTGAQRATRRQYGVLVVMQVGLALALLVGAGMLLRSAAALYQLDINPILERLVSGYARVTPIHASDHRRLADISADLVSRARVLPGVQEAATVISRAPAHQVITVDDVGGHMREIPAGRWSYRVVSASYLRTFGFPILKGRDFTEGEFAESVAIVDEQTARFLWPGGTAIGRMIKLGSDARRDEGWLRVVGVVKYVNLWSAFTRANQEERLAAQLAGVYVINGADPSRLLGRDSTRSNSALIQVVVRGTTDVQRLPVLVRNALTNAAAGVSMTDARQMYSVLQLNAARERQDFMAALFMTFGLLALGVAALGVYAVVSHSVWQRTREIGVRIALGASERDIRQRVLFEGNVLALTGIAIGLIIARGTIDHLQAFLRGEGDRYDAWLYALVALVLFAATLLAAWIPARRAMRINPVEALRND